MTIDIDDGPQHPPAPQWEVWCEELPDRSAERIEALTVDDAAKVWADSRKRSSRIAKGWQPVLCVRIVGVEGAAIHRVRVRGWMAPVYAVERVVGGAAA